MKIVTFQGGLGNQLFQYVFYLWLNAHCNKEYVYGYYPKKGLNAHNGLEIEKVFNVKLPSSSLFTDLIVRAVKLINKLFANNKYISVDECLDIHDVLFEGFWQDKCFFNGFVIDKMLDFKLPKRFDAINSSIRTKIQYSNSISIHIRRGDYLLPKYKNIYGDICDEGYYQRAIKYMQQFVVNPSFFVFSDDVKWAKNIINVSDVTFVNNNERENSYIDMYLMSLCHHNIIANSTFSWWGAQLNKHSDKIMIAPINWFKSVFKDPDIFTENWIRI